MKKILYWIIFVLLCIWQLPQFLVSVLFLPFLGKLKIVANRHYNICFKASNMKGGISLGPFSYVSENIARYETHISHEVDGHTVQSKILGPLYLIIIGLPSLIHAAIYDSHKTCYYDYWCEKWANDLAGLTATKFCNLMWKKSK